MQTYLEGNCSVVNWNDTKLKLAHAFEFSLFNLSKSEDIKIQRLPGMI